MNQNNHFFKELIAALENKTAGDISSAEMESFMAEAMEEHSVELILSSGDRYQFSLHLPFENGQCEFTDVAPGEYQLQIAGGRILWQGFLPSELLILDKEVPLALAADTDDIGQPPTKTISLISSECDMQVFAGLESGKVRIQTTHE